MLKDFRHLREGGIAAAAAPSRPPFSFPIPLCLFGVRTGCRVIYKYALDQMPREQVPELYRDFIGFEKRHGSVQGIEEVRERGRRRRRRASCMSSY